MAKISFALVVFALVLALPCTSVFGQEYSWQSVLDQASQAGISQVTIDQAQSAISDGFAQKAAAEALGNADEGEADLVGDWVKQASDLSNKASPPPPAQVSPAEAPEDAADDEVSDSPAEAPENSATKAPEVAPTNAPVEAPELAPTDAPSEAPELTPTNAPLEAPELAPTNAPSAAPQAQAPYAATPRA